MKTIVNDSNLKEQWKGYFPGKLIVIINEFFCKQQLLKNENEIDQWEEFIDKYFNEDSICCFLFKQNTTKMFRLEKQTLPIVFRSKYEENVILGGAFLNNTEEYILSNGKYLLIINDFCLQEKYSNNIIITKGELKIIFAQNLKIEIYEFKSKKHQKVTNFNENDLIINSLGMTPQFTRTLLIADILTEMNYLFDTFILNNHIH